MANNLPMLRAFYLLCFVAIHASCCTQEHYWKMKLPKVPIPQAVATNLLLRAEITEDKGKMVQPFTVSGWRYKADDHEEKGGVVLPFTVGAWRYNTDDIEKKGKVDQPFTVGAWQYNADDTEKKGKMDQPFTVYGWRYNADDTEKKGEIAQPFTVGAWRYKADDTEKKGKMDQPFTVGAWRYNADDNQKKGEVAQPFTVGAWRYNADNTQSHKSHDHFMHHSEIEDDMIGGSVFFIEKDLQVGKNLRHDFQKSPKAPFLPKEMVESLPFAMDKYSEIISRLSINPGSVEAKSIKETLSLCFERPKVKKENRTCVQSLEGIVDFVVGELGTGDVKLAMMDDSEDSVPTGMQDYVVAKVKKLEIPGNNAVACHKMVYPYAVYWCHHQKDIGHYSVTLTNPEGITVDTTAVCHYDTYAWAPDVPSLRYLGIKPGDAPVCHFSGINDMFWSLNGPVSGTVGTRKSLKAPQ